MDYSSIRRSPRQLPSLPISADEENHSFFDFPDALGDVKKKELDDRNRIDNKSSRPYPASISIQHLSPTSKQSDTRSPLVTPVRNNKETRQPNSPPDSVIHSSPTKYDSELSKHHSHGLIHFNSNRLSEAVDSYSHAIRIGLDDLIHHKEMASRLMTSKRDDMILELGTSLAQVHNDMGQCLEVAQKYTEAKAEYENGLGMLQHTCLVSRDDKRLKQLESNIKRMERAESVEDERQRQNTSLEKALRRLKQASTSNDQDNARKSVISSFKKSLRIERDCLGENSYAFAKLRLKLAKVKCEGGDIEGGLQDANHALATAKSVLGSRHTLVGAACLFVAAVYEKSALMEFEKSKSKLFNISAEKDEDVLLSPKCKKLIAKALECYADAVEPLQFKHDNNTSKKQSAIHPDLGDTYHKIAKLNVKRGSYAPAFEAMHRSLEAYGTSARTSRGSTSNTTLHPNATLVWKDLASLHLASKEYSDAIYAAEKAVELSHQVSKSFYSEQLAMVPVDAFQITGDGYCGLHRLEDATISYQKANSELQKTSNGGNSRSIIAFHRIEAKILRKLGMSYYHRGMNDDAKTMLTNALSTLRSNKDEVEGSSDDTPSLLIDIGMVNIACGDNAEAMKVLRSCLKMFADRGVPDHLSEVSTAKKLFKDAQRAMTQSGAVDDIVYMPVTKTQMRRSSIKVHAELDSSKKMPSIEGNSYEATPNAKQLEQLQQHIKEVEKERDQEKKDRIFAAAIHRKEMESITQSNRSVLEAELESLRRKLNISEGSYQELVKFIENEKEQSNEAHESKVRELHDEIRQLRDKMDSSGAIENMRLSDELEAQLCEAALLKQRFQEASTDVESLRTTNRMLQSEKRAADVEINALKSKNDAMQREIQQLTTKLAGTQLLSLATCVPATDTDTKKLEFELQSERNRRQILEETLQKEFEKGGFGYGGGGGYAYPMPFGFPPMQMADTSSVAKLKNLEIDLATELADKKMLEKVIEETRISHEQEKSSMLSEYSSFVQLHEQETSGLLTQIAEKSAEVDALNQELINSKAASDATTDQLHDTMNELSDVNEKLSRVSLELSSLLKVKEQLSYTKNELVTTKEALHKITTELNHSENVVRQQEAECSHLSSENERLKTEYGEAIDMFESEISRLTGDNEAVHSSLGNEVQRLQSELSNTKSQLQNALVKLEVLDSDRKVMRSTEEQLRKTQHELNELSHNYEELETTLAELEEIASSEKMARKESGNALENIRGKWIASEKITEKLKDEQNEIKAQLSASTTLNKKLGIVLQSVVRQLEGALPELEVSPPFSDDVPIDERSTPSPESVRARISHLLQQISRSTNEVDKAHRELSKVTDELHVLEAKHKTLKQELAEMGDLQKDYDDLLDQYEQLVEEKSALDERQDVENESLLKVEKERALLEARLEDAYDNVQALEAERSTLHAELASAREDITKKEGRILALEADNQLIDTLEKQALEYDAELMQRDEKLKILERFLQSCGSQLDGSMSHLTSNKKDASSCTAQDDIPLCFPCTQVETNPFADDSTSDGGENRSTTNPFDDDSSTNSFNEDERDIDYREQIAELQSRVNEMEGINRCLAQQIDDMKIKNSEGNLGRALSAKENEALNDEIHALKIQNELLSAELSDSNEEAVIAAKIHENDGAAISSLQDALHRGKQLHEEELECWIKRFHELQNSYVMLREQLDRMNSEPDSDNMESQVTFLTDRVRYLENMNAELNARLANVVQNEDSTAFNDQDERYQSEICTWKSRVIELEESIEAFRHQVSEQNVEVSVSGELEECRRRISSLENDLQNALDGKEERNIDHNLELARVNAEFHNAMVSLDELSKENKSLKNDIDLLLSKETEDDEQFEKERTAAHQRFESMEKALQERLLRMEKEKARLEADFNDEMVMKEEEIAQITIELCAWKLGKHLY
jgi:chromosome segregation ATPase